jgi:dipeptidyl-peptidase-4
VRLDGTGDKRLTDPKFHHTINLAPDGKHFLDTYETASVPPTTVLRDGEGKQLAVLAESDLTEFHRLNLKPTEVFTFTAADGKTVCYGTLDKPSHFDPTKKYPLLISVYAGPDSGGVSEIFTAPNALTEFGFLVASLHGRNATGLGKRALDSLYLKLGVTEIDDQAAGVRELLKRPYVDGARVGIFGTSYGGYASLMCLLRYPELFSAACASASVTDWRNYDSIYTERYMWIPQENEEGYRNGSAMTYARNLQGALMLFHGTADDNVHLANSVQLIQALQRAGKSFEVQLGPDQGHAGINLERMMEFFIENLVLKPEAKR